LIDAFKTNGSSPPRTYTIKEVRFRVVREAGAPDPRLLDQPGKVAELAHELVPDDAREHFFALYLNSRNQLVATHEVSVGTLSGSLVHPREVLGPALRVMGVASLVLVHNHPSGDPTPGQDDIRLTRQLIEAGKLLDLTIHDHVIIGDGRDAYVSFAERGLLS
jgi:DNA repair protein RadC